MDSLLNVNRPHSHRQGPSPRPRSRFRRQAHGSPRTLWYLECVPPSGTGRTPETIRCWLMKMAPPAGLEPAPPLGGGAHRRRCGTPSLTERNGTIHGPAARRPKQVIRVTAGANFTGSCPVYQIPAVECGTSRADRYISRPTRPMHPLAFGICRARLNLVWKRTPPIAFESGSSLPFSSTGRMF